MMMPRKLPQSVVDFLEQHRNPPKPQKPYRPLTDDELRAKYGKRHDEPENQP